MTFDSEEQRQIVLALIAGKTVSEDQKAALNRAAIAAKTEEPWEPEHFPPWDARHGQSRLT